MTMVTTATSATLSMGKSRTLKEHNCCYCNCPEPGTIHIGPNGGDSHWICFRHLDRWNQNRARFLADGGRCEMEELGELLEEE
jgi:hypothetical protein